MEFERDGRNKLLLAVCPAPKQGAGRWDRDGFPWRWRGRKIKRKKTEKNAEVTDVTVCTIGRASGKAYAPCVVGGPGPAGRCQCLRS